MRTDRQYENFVLQVDWMHIEPGGNSGLYVWTAAPKPGRRGIEIQILDLDWVRLQTKEGSLRLRSRSCTASLSPSAASNSCRTTLAARGACRLRIERRDAANGTPIPSWPSTGLKLAVNGKFVNGIAQATQKKGYLGLQSEGAEIHFRNIRIMELPAGVTIPQPAASVLS